MNRSILYLKNRIKTTPVGVWMMDFYRNHINRGKKAAYETMNKFGYADLSENEKNRIYKDMENCAQKWSFSYSEYFLYGFKDKSDQERTEFVSDNERVTFCEKLNKPENQIIFDDKTETARVFANFFKRDSLALGNESGYDAFMRFVCKYERVMVKPISSACGHGIKIITKDDDLQSIFDKYTKGLFGGGLWKN